MRVGGMGANTGSFASTQTGGDRQVMPDFKGLPEKSDHLRQARQPPNLMN
jgi:hypothetical protein